MSQNLPPQSDFPLTLAEVLLEELEPKWADLVEETLAEQEENPGTLKTVQAVWKGLHAPWGEVHEKIEKIRNLQTEEEAAQIVRQEQLTIDPSAKTPSERIWNCKNELSKRLVPELYGIIRKLPPKRSALCLSGGGVRSATFNLGVLQGLARCGLLQKFDYLSTVSGGGFIGGWLSAWIHRAGNDVNNVAKQLAASPQNPLEPEPKPLYNLRVYANYLTPKKGLMSVDTWTLVAVYLRNLFLNWFVFLPAIMTVLMLPRIWAAIVALATHPSPFVLVGSGILGVLCGLTSLLCILQNLPSVGDGNWERKTILYLGIVPLVLTAMLLSLYWVGVSGKPLHSGLPMTLTRPWSPFVQDLIAVFEGKRPSWPSFLLAGALMPALPQLWASMMKRKTLGLKQVVESTCLVLIGGALAGALTYALGQLGLLHRLASYGWVSYDQLYVCLSVPYLMVLLTVGGTLVAGASSRFSRSEDQEWWARCGAFMLLFAVGWAVVSLLVMFGPLLLVNIPALFRGENWGTVKGLTTTVVGILSGLFALLGGFSSRTPAHANEEKEPDLKTRLVGFATSGAAVIFLLFFLILLVWLTDWVGFGVAKMLQASSYYGKLPGEPLDHKTFINDSTFWLQVFVTGALFVVAGVTGYFINTNRFSLHYYWRNRMMRAYLGSSRDPNERDQNKNIFTDFSKYDDVQMHDLKQKRPVHIVDVTLNLVGGEKLEWQDRKAESFTISPLHCGSYWLGYRKSREYGGDQGISLATAAAISGAAASPNMGYMMTSPIVRIIMTLFNVRMGFWLGNPGLAGAKRKRLPAFNRDSPRESVRPIVAEALGMTDDKKPYVYLSDGGHFENLGLYEMILRRCRFIVIGDASTDTEYAYDSLALAIRQIRVDFGVPIDMGEMKFNNYPDAGNNYCAVGLIKYACVDRPGGSSDDAQEDAKYDGVLVYIKPSLIGNEPRDILNYHATSPTFPEETIADQWFSESQFESYRALGSHMVETICHADEKPVDDQPERVVIGSVKISSEANTNREELSVLGWIEKLGSKSGPERGTPGVEKRISEVIKVLTPAAGDTPKGIDFAGFVEKANQHVGRRQNAGVKD